MLCGKDLSLSGDGIKSRVLSARGFCLDLQQDVVEAEGRPRDSSASRRWIVEQGDGRCVWTTSGPILPSHPHATRDGGISGVDERGAENGGRRSVSQSAGRTEVGPLGNRWGKR